MAECYQEEQRFQLGLMDDAAECFVRGGGRKGGGGYLYMYIYMITRQGNTTTPSEMADFLFFLKKK